MSKYTIQSTDIFEALNLRRSPSSQVKTTRQNEICTAPTEIIGSENARVLIARALPVASMATCGGELAQGLFIPRLAV